LHFILDIAGGGIEYIKSRVSLLSGLARKKKSEDDEEEGKRALVLYS
jgi:hypothetical protein